MIEKTKQFFRPPVFKEQEKTIMARNSYFLAVIGASTSLLMFVFFLLFFPENSSRVAIIGFSVILSLLPFALLHKGHVRLTIFFQASIIWVSVVAVSFSAGGVDSVGFIGGTIAALLVMGISLEWRSTLIFIVASIFMASLLAGLEAQGVIVDPKMSEKPVALVASYGAFLFVLAGLLNATYYSVTNALAKANQELIERQHAEAEIQKLNAELEQRVKERTIELETTNKELEAFSYSVSHDLRAPLRAMNGYARIVSEDFTETMHPDAQDYLEKIRVSGLEMSQLIDALLDFSLLGRRPIDKQEVDIRTLVCNIIESLSGETANRKIEWILTELPSAWADQILIQQVYVNLIGNAVKYTGKCLQARIEVGSFSQDGQLIYYVRDNGAGFDMKYADNLFGVFQRLHSKNEFEGTGIGLATVQRIIHRHGGRIWAEAEPGKGATFYFMLG